MPPSNASLFQRWPAQPKNRLPSTLNPPITPSVCALSIGSMPQIAKYDGRCVVMKTSCIPQTKYAQVITTNDALPNAIFAATPAEVSAIWSDARGGSGTLSTLPANQAAGSSASDKTTKPARPVRQPYPSLSICPSGADNSAPSDPAAETMPSTVLRTVAGTARAATDIAIAAAVQANDVPISTPAPSMTLRKPCAAAISDSPAI